MQKGDDGYCKARHAALNQNWELFDVVGIASCTMRSSQQKYSAEPVSLRAKSSTAFRDLKFVRTRACYSFLQYTSSLCLRCIIFRVIWGFVITEYFGSFGPQFSVCEHLKNAFSKISTSTYVISVESY